MPLTLFVTLLTRAHVLSSIKVATSWIFDHARQCFAQEARDLLERSSCISLYWFPSRDVAAIWKPHTRNAAYRDSLRHRACHFGKARRRCACRPRERRQSHRFFHSALAPVPRHYGSFTSASPRRYAEICPSRGHPAGFSEPWRRCSYTSRSRSLSSPASQSVSLSSRRREKKHRGIRCSKLPLVRLKSGKKREKRTFPWRTAVFAHVDSTR